MVGWHHLVRPDALAPDTRAELLRERGQLGRRARRVVAHDDGRAPAAEQERGGCLDPGRVGLGRATNTGPAGGSVAIFSARCMISGNSSARSTWTLHLVSGAAIATRSCPSTGPRRRRRVSCCPAVTTSGARALKAL